MLIESNLACTGCGACKSICPRDAVSMSQNSKGAYVPIVDEEKCIHCGLCERTCPTISEKKFNEIEPKCYTVANKDDDVRRQSASGGVFGMLAKYVLSQQGVVFGAIVDEKLTVRHVSAQTETELVKLFSSKYVQSDTGETFREAKGFLDSGRSVLYSGTPCQIAGLKSFLGKEYDNLLTAEVICHGTPTPLVFEKYKKEVKNLTGVNFRPKDKGWGVIVVTRYIDGKPKYISTLRDSFMKAFLNNLSLNDCCVECRFNKLPRVADITMGDFWGVDLYDKSLNDKKGLSVVLVNSQKGQKIFDKIKSDGVCTELPLEVAIKFNHNIVGTTLPHPKRVEFFKRLNDESLEKLADRLAGRVSMFKEALNMVLPQKVTRFIRKYLLGRKDV